MQALIPSTLLLSKANADALSHHAPALGSNRSLACWRHRLPAPCPVPTLAASGYLCRPGVRACAATTVYDTEFVAAVNVFLSLTPQPPPPPPRLPPSPPTPFPDAATRSSPATLHRWPVITAAPPCNLSSCTAAARTELIRKCCCKA